VKQGFRHNSCVRCSSCRGKGLPRGICYRENPHWRCHGGLPRQPPAPRWSEEWEYRLSPPVVGHGGTCLIPCEDLCSPRILPLSKGWPSFSAPIVKGTIAKDCQYTFDDTAYAAKTRRRAHAFKTPRHHLPFDKQQHETLSS